jgi:gas vesicle protein
MKHFMKGVLVGIGAGLLIAPMKGEELRRVISARVTEWRNSLPEDSRINQYTHQISDQVTYTKEHWRDYAQQAASVAKDTGTTLGNKAKQSGFAGTLADKAKQTSQDLASKAKQTGQDIAGRAKQGVGFGKSSDNTGTRIIPEDREYRGDRGYQD